MRTPWAKTLDERCDDRLHRHMCDGVGATAYPQMGNAEAWLGVQNHFLRLGPPHTDKDDPHTPLLVHLVRHRLTFSEFKSFQHAEQQLDGRKERQKANKAGRLAKVNQGLSTRPGATKLQSRCQDMRSDQPHVPAEFSISIHNPVEVLMSEPRSVDCSSHSFLSRQSVCLVQAFLT